MKRITVYVGEEEYNKFRSALILSGQSVSGWFRDQISTHVVHVTQVIKTPDPKKNKPILPKVEIQPKIVEQVEEAEQLITPTLWRCSHGNIGKLCKDAKCRGEAIKQSFK